MECVIDTQSSDPHRLDPSSRKYSNFNSITDPYLLHEGLMNEYTDDCPLELRGDRKPGSGESRSSVPGEESRGTRRGVVPSTEGDLD